MAIMVAMLKDTAQARIFSFFKSHLCTEGFA
jgi:hypothetical protein